VPALHYLPQFSQIYPAARVHLQAQISGEMPEAPCYQPAQLLRLGLIQKKLTHRAAPTVLFPEKSVLRATLDHQ
jgi:hypothetical protein